MCEMCDGMTLEETLKAKHARIGRYGFTMTGIEAGPDQPWWLYTVGLVEGAEHPELSLMGVPLPHAYDVLDEVAGRVQRGHWFDVGDSVDVRGSHFHVQEIDPGLWDGPAFNQWKNYYAWRHDVLRREPPVPQAIELVPCGRQLHPWETDADAARSIIDRMYRGP